MARKSSTKAEKSEKGSSKRDAEGAQDSLEPTAKQKKLDLMKEVGAGEADNDQETLKISDSYSKRYNRRKDREELERASRILADEDSSASTEEEEDEAAELLTDKVEGKIFETLHKIKSKDPAIYDKKHVFFQNEDFDAPTPATGSSSSSSSSKKRVTYQDMLRETLLKEGAEAMTREDDKWETGKKKATPVDEQKELRSEMISAAHGDDEEDDDLFTLREKSKDEMKEEDESFGAFIAKKEKQRSVAGSADDMMTRYWKSDEDLGDSERFLRDYILNKSWMENTSMQSSNREGSSDSDSEEHEAADEFEKEYNFRFEMEGGQQIQGHKRFQQNSVRQRDDKRKRQRQERKERKEGDKVRRIEELKRLKNLKKQEILRRLKQLQVVTGNSEIPLDNISLDADFDPSSHDQEMGAVFNEAYDEGDEDLQDDELVSAPQGCDDLDVSTSAADSLNRRRKEKQKGGASVAAAQEEFPDAAPGEGEWEEGEADDDEAAADPEVWWLCDECGTGIPGGKRRFDCTVCENYTLCVKCFRVRKHPHKFVRQQVPKSSMPPEPEEGAVEARAEEAQPEELEKLLDEHFQLDYEDIIGGDLPTRFKYRKVESSSFGLTAEDILTKTDKELNKMMPLKKITRSYRERGEADFKKPWKAHVETEWQQKRGGKKKEGGPGGMSKQRLDAYSFDVDKKREFKQKLQKKDRKAPQD